LNRPKSSPTSRGVLYFKTEARQRRRIPADGITDDIIAELSKIKDLACVLQTDGACIPRPTVNAAQMVSLVIGGVCLTALCAVRLTAPHQPAQW
jgi:TolB-like protein